jgi:hypothetical protein
MARGWESKSVEEQQSIASEDMQGKRMAAEDAQKATARRTLELQISQVEAQLAAARSDRHREMLESALADLRKQMSVL